MAALPGTARPTHRQKGAMFFWASATGAATAMAATHMRTALARCASQARGEPVLEGKINTRQAKTKAGQEQCQIEGPGRFGVDDEGHGYHEPPQGKECGLEAAEEPAGSAVESTR